MSDFSQGGKLMLALKRAFEEYREEFFAIVVDISILDSLKQKIEFDALVSFVREETLPDGVIRARHVFVSTSGKDRANTLNYKLVYPGGKSMKRYDITAYATHFEDVEQIFGYVEQVVKYRNAQWPPSNRKQETANLISDEEEWGTPLYPPERKASNGSA